MEKGNYDAIIISFGKGGLQCTYNSLDDYLIVRSAKSSTICLTFKTHHNDHSTIRICLGGQ